MAGTTATSSCTTTAFVHLYAPTPPPPRKFSLLSTRPTSRRANLSTSIGLHKISSNSPFISNIILQSVSSTETPIVEEEQEEIETPTSEANLSPDSGSVPPLTGCKACGRAEIENGCNGEGRIQGGIATVPGFGWWPIKAYRPCPAFVASGGRYRRSGQSMDEVVSGGASRNISNGTQSSKKVKGLKKSKR